jgi:hypothetical protein
MKNFCDMKQVVAFAMICLLAGNVFTACNAKKESKKKEGFHLTGTLEGVTEGKIKAYTYKGGEQIYDTLEVKEGKFEMTYDFPVPTRVTLELISGGEWRSDFYAENSKMTITAKNGSFDRIVSGGKFQAAADEFSRDSKAFRKTQPSVWDLRSVAYDPKASQKDKQEAEDKIKEIELAYTDWQKNYIKEHPTNPYCAHIVYERLVTKVGGESASQLKAWAEPIDQSIRKHPYVAMMFRTLNTMLETEAGLEKFVADASHVAYKVEKSYKGGAHKNISYLSVFKNNNVCALTGTSKFHEMRMDGADKEQHFYIQIIDPSGKEIKRFEAKVEGTPSSLAVDANDNIYVLSTIQEEVVNKVRGRSFKSVKSVGAKCTVYNTAGDELNSYMLEGRMKATGARIYEDKLLVADNGTAALGVYNAKDGKKISSIGNLRPCCSILDFDVDNKGNIIVANLGSFRVDGYDLSGKKLVSFGQRGKGINDFHGCCNPVSVRKLDNGCIITVEKTPTRIKVYSKDGAKTIAGIEELVQGCFHIPVISDARNNIYLASPEKGLVKCVVL